MLWDTLRACAREATRRPIRALFEADPNRAGDFAVEALEMRFDYSRTQIDAAARKLLVQTARLCGVTLRREEMFAGLPINDTEGRAVLHTALRNPDDGPIMVDGQDVMPFIRETLTRMEAFAEAVRRGDFQAQGGPVTDVVNIGIGGSDLGPAMGTRALSPWADGPRVHFVSNVDSAHIADTLAGLDPTRTLVVVVSKTFTTVETMTNARTAMAWMARAVADPARQFVAVSSNLERTREFGIPPERVFGFGDYVGGRYSMWGPVGLSMMLAIGPTAFRAFLRGGREMDTHFRTAELLHNMPVMLALVGIWHNQVLGHATRAVLPYEQRLELLPPYLQQLEMESNGKGVHRDGSPLRVDSGPVVWGAPGTNGQHAFFQLIHQGTRVVPCEFMVGARGHEPELKHHHDLLLANCLAQGEALMRGRSLEEARRLMAARGYSGDELERQARHRVFPGNRPSTLLVYPSLTPEVLGRIIALYEHRVFVEGVILDINSFDQWGVELGKELATALLPAVAGEAPPPPDPATARTLDWVRRAAQDAAG